MRASELPSARDIELRLGCWVIAKVREEPPSTDGDFAAASAAGRALMVYNWLALCLDWSRFAELTEHSAG